MLEIEAMVTAKNTTTILESLRGEMSSRHLDAYVIPSRDAHYVRNKLILMLQLKSLILTCRANTLRTAMSALHLSGFDGIPATTVVTKNKAKAKHTL